MRSHWQVPGIRTWYVWGHLSASTMGFSKSHKEIFFSSVYFSFLPRHTWYFLELWKNVFSFIRKTERNVISLCALRSRLESQGQTENLWLTTSLNWRLHGMNCMYNCNELNHKRVCLPVLSWKHLGFPSGSVVKNLPTKQETRVWFWVGKIPWRRKWQPTPVFLPGKFHGQRSLVGYTSRDHRVRHD